MLFHFHRLSNVGDTTWTDKQPIGMTISNVAPALVVWNGVLYMAFVANDGTNAIQLVSSKNGANWTPILNIGQYSGQAPALAVLNDTLYLAFVANNLSDNLLIVSSQDGMTWTDNQSIGQCSGQAPAMTVWKNRLYMTFVADDDSKNLLVVSSKDGMIWTGSLYIGQASSVTPALTIWNDDLYMIFVANDSTHDLLLTSTKDGVTWTSNQNIEHKNFWSFLGLGRQASQLAPALAVWNDTLYMAFVANDDSKELLLTSSSHLISVIPTNDASS